MAESEQPVAIKVEGLSKTFKLPHEKTTSIKSIVVNFWRRDRGYELQQALKDISFEIKQGEFFGIVGRNGSGKSTLLKILAGIYMPTKGGVQVNGKLTPFIELGVGFNDELTGRENVFLNGALLGFSRKEMREMYADIVEFAELERFMDQKLKNYSSGMKVRLAFSISIRVRSDILLIDEVLAVGDADFQRKCFDYFKTLKKNKKTVVLVSHDMNAVTEFCDRAALIEGGNVVVMGSSRDVAQKYAMLFMDSDDDVDFNEDTTAKRMGNGEMRVSRVAVKLNDENLIVNVKAKANKAIDGLLYGIHILASDGKEITAMNNRMIEVPDIKDIKAGSEIEFQWEMLNIFSDGKYYITLTLTDNSMTTLDYYPEAVNFRVRRAQRSNTEVIPPVSVTHKISK